MDITERGPIHVMAEMLDLEVAAVERMPDAICWIEDQRVVVFRRSLCPRCQERAAAWLAAEATDLALNQLTVA